MKIAIIVEDYKPVRGYTEYYLKNNYIKLGHSVCVYCFGSKTQIRQISNQFQIFMVRSKFSINGYSIPSVGDFLKILRHLIRNKPDVIHAQPLFSPLSVLFILLKETLAYKIVGSLVTGTMNLEGLKSRIKFFILRNLVKIFTRKIDTFFALNRTMTTALSQVFDIPKNKFKEIPLGSDSRIFNLDPIKRKSLRLQFGISAEETLLVYSGLFSKEKGIHLLVEVVSDLIHEGYQLRLLLIGGGTEIYTDYLKQLCNESNISSNVIFHQWVHRTKLPELYSAGDIAVWPGLPSISIIEAAAVSLPIIITKSILTKHLVEYDNGLIFSSGNILELKGCIEELLQDKKRRVEMGKRSRKLVKEKFDWALLAKRYIEIYSQIIS